VVAVENEYAMLLVQASAHGARAGGVFTGIVNRRDHPSHWEYPPYNDNVLNGIERMIVVALDGLAAL
jgi:uridine phosphorylase